MTAAFKIEAAQAALDYLPQEDSIIGIGSGSTVNAFIDLLPDFKHRIEGVVSASCASTKRLKALGIPTVDLNSVASVPVYFDGADAINALGYCLKGGGGALTSEKIIAQAAKQFVCMVDHTKMVKSFHDFPITIEVIASARSLVARYCVTLGGNPIYREGFVTDHGHIILDVYDLPTDEPLALSAKLDATPGLVCHGLFVHQTPQVVLIAGPDGVEVVC